MDAELRLSLYRTSLLIRLVEETIAEIYSEWEMRCPTHLSTGQEAAAAGACLAVNRTDYAVSGHRSHGHYLAKGGNLKAMMAEIYGKATGCAGGKGGSMHLVDLDAGFLGAAPIVGSTIPIGVGAAFGSCMKGDDRVTLVFLGDGATETGVFHESLNFAALKNLPVVFVCENNLYSVYSPLGVRQPEGRPITGLAEGHGIEAHVLDGNDAEVVYLASLEAVNKAREGQGPTFLELSTYRWREHCGPNFDNHIGYRTDQEFHSWKEKDPLELHRAQILEDDITVVSELDAMAAELQSDIDAAIEFAKSSPFPSLTEAGTNVYAPHASSGGE